MIQHTKTDITGSAKIPDRVMLAELSALNKRVVLHPNDINAWVARGNMHLSPLLGDRGRPTRAMADFEQALSLNPEDADAWKGRGRVLFAWKRYEEAAEAFTKAVDLSEGNNFYYRSRGSVLVLVYRGMCYKRTGDLKQASRDLRDAIRLSEDHLIADFAALILDNIEGEKNA